MEDKILRRHIWQIADIVRNRLSVTLSRSIHHLRQPLQLGDEGSLFGHIGGHRVFDVREV